MIVILSLQEIQTIKVALERSREAYWTQLACNPELHNHFSGLHQQVAELDVKFTEMLRRDKPLVNQLGGEPQ